jgi:hypothetical protein
MHSVNQEIEGTRVKRHQYEGSAHDARFRIIQPLVIGHIGGGTASENEPDEERIIYGLNQDAEIAIVRRVVEGNHWSRQQYAPVVFLYEAILQGTAYVQGGSGGRYAAR